MAGPIVRADYFLPQLRRNERATPNMIWGGLWLIIVGIIKKALIADYIAQYNDLVFNDPGFYTGLQAFMGVIGYTMQIYCDFSGYSDMAIGLASIMGFRLGINFDSPYQSRNLTEFWRRDFARMAFGVSSAYDSAIFNWFDRSKESALRLSLDGEKTLRYGENPHQQGRFFGDFDKMFTQLHGKEISYNNILDIDAALSLIGDFTEPTVAILKHNNPCGLACGENLADVWRAALDCDPVSAFGGVIVTNREVDADTAGEMDKIFFEVIVAPGFTGEALATLRHKKNRIILHAHSLHLPSVRTRSALNGYLQEDADELYGLPEGYTVPTDVKPTEAQLRDMALANTLVKHFRSNAIVLLKDGKLLGAGMGQVSRIDALKHAIQRAREAGRDLTGAVMASDAFFPFSDCVQLAYREGIRAVVQPGGSVRDNDTITFCQEKGIPMAMTRIRHFRH
mgnify:CR=1 FL=1